MSLREAVTLTTGPHQPASDDESQPPATSQNATCDSASSNTVTGELVKFQKPNQTGHVTRETNIADMFSNKIFYSY